jgi:hypothetical protein
MDDLAKISDLLNELQATNDRRLDLLKAIDAHFRSMAECAFCGFMVYDSEIRHAKDCRLWKELSDAESTR